MTRLADHRTEFRLMSDMNSLATDEQTVMPWTKKGDFLLLRGNLAQVFKSR
jgi:hypothetical protein